MILGSVPQPSRPTTAAYWTPMQCARATDGARAGMNASGTPGRRSPARPGARSTPTGPRRRRPPPGRPSWRPPSGSASIAAAGGHPDDPAVGRCDHRDHVDGELGAAVAAVTPLGWMVAEREDDAAAVPHAAELEPQLAAVVVPVGPDRADGDPQRPVEAVRRDRRQEQLG